MERNHLEDRLLRVYMVSKIIKCIDRHIAGQRVRYIDFDEAVDLLYPKGLLTSTIQGSRRKLYKILRDGKIPYAYISFLHQWLIPHSRYAKNVEEERRSGTLPRSIDDKFSFQDDPLHYDMDCREENISDNHEPAACQNIFSFFSGPDSNTLENQYFHMDNEVYEEAVEDTSDSATQPLNEGTVEDISDSEDAVDYEGWEPWD